MSKITLTAIAAFISQLSFSQITITSADMPNAGDSVLVSHTVTAVPDFELTDTNYVWDYSFLAPDLQRYEKFDSPVTFTSPFNFIFNPTNCSFGKDNYQLTTLPLPGITLDDAYDFMKETSTVYRQVGAGYTLNGSPIPFLYTAADTIYNFPVNYGNTDSCDYRFGLPIPGMGYYGQKGHRVNTVDGWGTLTTPYGNYNVLRITSVVSAIDTVYSSAFGFGTNITRPKAYQYKWMAPGMKVPVLQIDATETGGNKIVNNVQYIDTIQPGVPQVGIAEQSSSNTISVFPNPSSGPITFLINDAQAETLIITDISGKLVRKESIKGKNKFNLIAEELQPGIYIYMIRSSSHIISSGKLVLQ
jgi:hypothetical protein